MPHLLGCTVAIGVAVFAVATLVANGESPSSAARPARRRLSGRLRRGPGRRCARADARRGWTGAGEGRPTDRARVSPGTRDRLGRRSPSPRAARFWFVGDAGTRCARFLPRLPGVERMERPRMSQGRSLALASTAGSAVARGSAHDAHRARRAARGPLPRRSPGRLTAGRAHSAASRLATYGAPARNARRRGRGRPRGRD